MYSPTCCGVELTESRLIKRATHYLRLENCCCLMLTRLHRYRCISHGTLLALVLDSCFFLQTIFEFVFTNYYSLFS